MSDREIGFADVFDNVEVISLEMYKEHSTRKTKMVKVIDQIGFDKAEVKFLDKVWRVAYTKSEADKLGVKYVHYSEFKHTDAPGYVLFEDQWVGFVMKAFLLQWTFLVVTPIGDRTFYRKNRRTGAITSAKPSFDVLNAPFNMDVRNRLANMPYGKKQIVASLMASGCDANQIQVYFANNVSPISRRHIKVMMARKEIKEMATKKVDQALEEAGMTPDFVIEWAKDAHRLILERKDTRSLVALIGEVANWTGFNDKEVVKTTDTIEAIDYEKDLLTMKETEQKLKLTKKTEE